MDKRIDDYSEDQRKQELIHSISETLKYYRKERGYTCRELAEKANCTASLVSAIEKKKTFTSLNKLDNLANALNIPIETFFSENPQESLSFENYDFEIDPMIFIQEFRKYLELTKKAFKNDVDIRRFAKEIEYLIERTNDEKEESRVTN